MRAHTMKNSSIRYVAVVELQEISLAIQMSCVAPSPGSISILSRLSGFFSIFPPLDTIIHFKYASTLTLSNHRNFTIPKGFNSLLLAYAVSITRNRAALWVSKLNHARTIRRNWTIFCCCFVSWVSSSSFPSSAYSHGVVSRWTE